MGYFVITGAHGFIGTNIADRILKLNPTELGLEKPLHPTFSNFGKGYEEGFSVLATDLNESLTRFTSRRFLGSSRYKYLDYKDLGQYLSQCESKPLAVIHNGACSSTMETRKEIFDELNLKSSKDLWHYCSKNKVPFIYASSAAVYGDGKKGFSDKKEDCESYRPLNLYGQSKLDFDIWTLKQSSKPPIWFGLRYFNVYGQFESHKKSQASMVYHGFNQIKKDGKIGLFKSNDPKNYSDGDQVRDFIYVDDIVSITLKLLQRSLEVTLLNKKNNILDNGLFLNLGCGIPETWNNLAKSIFSALDVKEAIDYIDMPEKLSKQYQNYTCANLETLSSLELNHNFFSLKDGVRKYVLEYLMKGL